MKKQLYVSRGKADYGVTNDSSTNIVDRLPAGVYRLARYPLVGFVFERVDDFDLPPKLYGSVNSRSKRILRTYDERVKQGKSLGVLLSGIKGSGKTLLAKKVATDSNLPVILINEPYHDDAFSELISGLGKAVVLFDEFEKIYGEKGAQNGLLTMLDGTFDVKALFFFIINDSYRLVDPLKNRPSRIYYNLEYGSLEKEFIKEYCEDRLHNQSFKMGVISTASLFSDFTFDMLAALVEECNRYNEPASEAVKYLNIKRDSFSDYKRYKLEALVIETGEILSIPSTLSDVKGHPMGKTGKDGHHFYYYERNEDDETVQSYNIRLSENNLISIDPEKEEFVFEQDGLRLTVTRNNSYSTWITGNNERTNLSAFSESMKTDMSLAHIEAEW